MGCESILSMCEECIAFRREKKFDELIDCMSVEQPANTTPIVFTRTYKPVEIKYWTTFEEACRTFENVLHDFTAVNGSVIAYHVRCSVGDSNFWAPGFPPVDFSLLVNLPRTIKVNDKTIAKIIKQLEIADSIIWLPTETIWKAASLVNANLALENKERLRLDAADLADRWVCHRSPEPFHANLCWMRWFAEPLRDTRRPATV
ncbi:hypothetical protein BJX65DRAFT_311888 [Aspergillus insuetus]